MDAVERVERDLDWCERNGYLTKGIMELAPIREVLSLARSNGWQDIATEQRQLLLDLHTLLNKAPISLDPDSDWLTLDSLRMFLDRIEAALRTKVGDELD